MRFLQEEEIRITTAKKLFTLVEKNGPFDIFIWDNITFKTPVWRIATKPYICLYGKELLVVEFENNRPYFYQKFGVEERIYSKLKKK